MRDDTTYFYARAETELELAQRATHPEAVRAHYIIANHYLDRCYGGGEAAVADGDASGGDDDGAGEPPEGPASRD
ncbi:hypothetical protein [Sphingomonas sp. 2SG]|jgi:hypothetical protein|uniref:hypothetical protein n=1 Tax=Sphingomonas sp. 2SG TaxID=2502201 RepID=UPI0010F7CFF5|nr:hypothetical protein [Sphingomonas sp. 2SG]